ncbi:cytochrome B [Xanthocytophaga agilis]|uniref:Cytochrome B n=1 Tax=Xanthocytophaga agilis TaxID=3048010 RepID=A0AAE3RAG2_9BACT|nr:cytochrome B [Xanthocytophaga agilis]MDJ1506936.1 cytochrome B [Xanthocytophaga agilis]
MYTGFVHLHNLLRWVILILLLVAIFRHFSGMNAKREFNSADKKVDLFLMIAAHITLLIGLVQWAIGPWGLQNILGVGMGEVMKSKVYRFWAVEHITGMIIGIALITVARGSFRKPISDDRKHKRALTLLVIALIVIFISIPWPFRGEIARPLFPGM